MISLDEFEGLGKRYSHYISALCVFHEDNNPSMMIYDDGYRCLACGAHGSLQKLADKIGLYTGLQPKIREQKFSDFRNPFNSWLRQNSISEFCYKAYQFLKRYPDQAVDLRKRKIDHLIDELLLGYFDGWYIFPVKDEWGNIVTAVARAGKTLQKAKDIRYMLPNDSPKVLYCPNWHEVKDQSVLRVAFGIIDAVSLYSIGFAAVSGLSGKSIDPSLFDPYRKIIKIHPDLGEEAEAYKLAGQLGWRGVVSRFDYPIDCKDSNDILANYGPQSLLSQAN